MSKEKQIEEMVKFVCMDCRYFMRCNDDTMCDGRTLSENIKEDCWTLKYAEELYNKGYRKQSEWISVEERLPDKDGRYLVAMKKRERLSHINKEV